MTTLINPYTMNCKMMYNDLAQAQDRVKRMWACASEDRDFALLEYMEEALENLQKELRNRLDK